jgi:HSP20 family protein
MEDLLRFDPFRELLPTLAGAGTVFSPDFDIEETEDRYLFRGDLPGLADSDIDISVTGNRLTINGKRESERKSEGANYYCAERSYGNFSRSFTLPIGTDMDNIKADLKNGVLTVAVPKTAEAQPRRIALDAGESKSGKQARA